MRKARFLTSFEMTREAWGIMAMSSHKLYFVTAFGQQGSHEPEH
jgi:hypothetical protein